VAPQVTLRQNKSSNVTGRRLRVLHVRPVASAREAHERQRRKLIAQGIPVFDREHDVVVGTQVEHRDGGTLQSLQYRLDREDWVLGPVPELLSCPLDRDLGAAISLT